MSEQKKECDICGNSLCVQWTDTHGFAACVTCGLPYRVYFYDENKNRIEKPMEVAIWPEYLPIGKRYWEETGRRTFPGCYDMMTQGDRSYSGATTDDIRHWNNWMKAHEAELPERRKDDAAND